MSPNTHLTPPSPNHQPSSTLTPPLPAASLSGRLPSTRLSIAAAAAATTASLQANSRSKNSQLPTRGVTPSNSSVRTTSQSSFRTNTPIRNIHSSQSTAAGTNVQRRRNSLSVANSRSMNHQNLVSTNNSNTSTSSRNNKVGVIPPVPAIPVFQRSSAENVQVTVRCRPITQRELTGRGENLWTVDTKERLVKSNNIRNEATGTKADVEYKFDHVFYGSDNEKLYQAGVKGLIDQAMDGYNATVFAYGQTASGKTYTMMGTEQEPGVIPRAVNEVFENIRQATNKEFLLRVSYLEIYNETIRDLLAPNNTDIKIHEDRRRGIYVSPLIEEIVTGPEKVMKIIQRGEANRHISTTDYNMHSSRSHTIFQMVIESRIRNNDSTTLLSPVNTQRRMSLAPNIKGRQESVKISHLNLIDLAGSEKAVTNQERRKEGAYINKSLLTLGTVISKLTEQGKSSAGHIPYRDSKLTRILQTALSGQAKVGVICTISPSSLDESHNTLKFAARVKKVVVTAKNEEVMDDKALLQRYRGEILDLKHKLMAANEVIKEEKDHTQSMLSAERRQPTFLFFSMKKSLNECRSSEQLSKKGKIDHLTRLILTSQSVNIPVDPGVSQIKEVVPGANINNNNNNTNNNNNNNNNNNINNNISSSSSSNILGIPLDPDHQDPWLLVRDLRKRLEETNLERQSLERQLGESKEYIRNLEIEVAQKKSLSDKVAHLEAELSITKAELQVTTILAREDVPTGSSRCLPEDSRRRWETNTF
ncbi:P-loop containing nucleoside triphosphate hydrolase protein [Phycomyces blakesleeanus]|uniref:Kinesin-like protein n=1 Tax=Phycomyces blakesleeanus TaxID=4837 RepID=A0ABR3BG06_PHYBL